MSSDLKCNEIIYNSVFKIINSIVKINYELPYQTAAQQQSIGAGFFIDNEGNALTAAHVIEDSIELWIKLPEFGEKIFNAEIKSVYPDFDLALIKVDIKNKFYLKLGNSDNLKLRETLFTIGYPSNPKYPIVTTGTFSGMRNDYLQTDTPVNSGNSGGPLINSENEVIGITSAKLRNMEDSSLALPVNIFKRNYKVMIQSNNLIIHKNVLGIIYKNNSNNYRKFHNISDNECVGGVIIDNIIMKSPLYKLLNKGDIICFIKINENIYLLDNYGETKVTWERGKVSLDKLIKRCLPNQMIKIGFFSLKKQKVCTKTFKLKTFEQVYPIRQLFFPLDVLDYEIYAGIIVMDLTFNHLMLEKFRHLNKIINDGRIFKSQLLICHIFPNSKISQQGSISNYTLVKKVNNRHTDSLKKFRKNINYPIVKNNNKYFLIENQINQKIILNLKEIIDESDKLKTIYHFN